MPKRKRDTPSTAKGDPNADSEDWARFDKSGKKQSKRKSETSRATAVGDASASAQRPFPQHNRPSEAESYAARDSLALLHGEPERPAASGEGKAQNSIIDSLVRTILSQNTTDTNSHRTFANLKGKFKDWEAVRIAKTGDVEDAIKLGGLAATKSVRIQSILNTVKEAQGQCSLEHLREQPDEKIKAELLQYNGVGPKTVACVLMFCLGRFDFPVDTHVWRIAKNLGWVPSKANREQTYEHLNAHIPPEIKYDLHVLLVEHGKRCPRCAKNHRPRKEVHGPCPLTNLAAAADKGGKLSAEKATKDAREALELKGEDLDDKTDKADGIKTEVKDEPGDEKPTESSAEQQEGSVKKEEGAADESAVKQEPIAVKEEPDVKPKGRRRAQKNA